MVKFQGKPIIDYIIGAVKQSGINEIVIVSGYKMDVLEKHLAGQSIKFYANEFYESTNMVSTLFCATPELNDDIIISYTDIIYSSGILKRLIDDPAEFSVVVDRDWKKLWAMRMEDPLLDAETMKVDGDGFIYELGKKPKSYDEINGQYIGLIKIKKDFLRDFIEYYYELDRNAVYDGKNFDNMYMTSLIQSIASNVKKPKAVFISGGWIEIDSVEDLRAYEASDLSIEE
jgi:choline kinase